MPKHDCGPMNRNATIVHEMKQQDSLFGKLNIDEITNINNNIGLINF